MLRFALLFLAVLALPIQAATVNDLYQTQVTLIGNDQQADQAAREQGLANVLVKISGNTDILNNPAIKTAITNSGSYISQFGYSQVDGQRAIDLSFDKNQIKQLLIQSKASIWKDQRPNILVWMVDSDGQQRNILWDQSTNALINDTKQAADSRGLPLTFPVGDITDATAVNVSDLWGNFIDPIAAASTRYHADGVLLVKAQQQPNGNVSLNWQFYPQQPSKIASADTQPITGTTSGTLAQTSTKMINQVTDYLAHKYAVVLGGVAGGQINIEVDNIQSTEDFFALEKMLNNLTTVGSANAMRIKGNSVIFQLNLQGSEQAFRQEISHDDQVHQTQSAVAFAADPVLPTATAPVGASTSTSTAPAITTSSVPVVNALTVTPQNIYYWNS
ncbi:hypothetical protein UA38_18175 [Photobacterium kishitanii]|uniref:DUF2066 domain-containing protein n=3 Tax=Photobacterium kishitanii TaxID=318456 RepID=A0AAX0YQD2_9GAMM|nr:hypothetical protein UA38_18175 [Photobacterium kishitanii]KJG58595.1 hypothetical protein UA42_19595 [Photobacterium kishitanii]KJG63898.1 hypothetical protein UA40_19615 [Photobacterium kishitanii]KJG67632.1 hypothetical protein UA41_19190 [Photobacterium kishitanii]PSX16997.1 DUF2066 domain-containing protein [Photobacterium kishitanii]